MSGFNPEKPQDNIEIVEIEGKKYRKIPSGYTVREYYSHHTDRMGPGPGWDYKQRALTEYGVDEPSQLPDDLHYNYELIEE